MHGDEKGAIFMIGKTERVILVKGDATKWYEQVIFIVNQSTEAEQTPVDFIAEAEKIIIDYNLKRANRAIAPVIYPPIPTPVKKRKTDFALSFLMGVACFVIVVVLVLGLLR